MFNDTVRVTCLFNDAVTSLDYTASMCKMIDECWMCGGTRSLGNLKNV
jgi:hypothetical protein